MAAFTTKLVEKKEITPEIMAFYLEKPEGFSYTPGQHGSFRLINPPETDSEGTERTFSFITIPSDQHIGFATRMRDTAFKRTMKQMAPGTSLEVLDPRGSMVLPPDTKRNLVFLTGGIGVTPFISMGRQAADTHSEQKIIMFYANKTREDAAFFTDFQELVKTNPNFTFVPIMTREDSSSGWNGETGHLTKEMIQKYLPSIDNTIFYLAGPAGLVNASNEILSSLGVDSLFIKSEDFGEYK